MEQERLRLKQERIGLNKDRLVKQRRYEQYSRLIKEQLIAEEDYRLAKEEYDAAKEQLDVIDERIRQDNIFRESQVNSLDENIRNMKQSLALVRERIENLKVKAPIDGQVGNLDEAVSGSKRRAVSYRFAVYSRTTGEYTCRADLSYQSTIGRPCTGYFGAAWRIFPNKRWTMDVCCG